MLTVKARKARPVISAVPSLVIVIDREMPIAREESRNIGRQRADALKLVKALEVSLPVGTLEKLSEILVDRLGKCVVKSRAAQIFTGKPKVTIQE